MASVESMDATSVARVTNSPEPAMARPRRPVRPRGSTALPQSLWPLVSGFQWYIRGYLRRHFNAVRVARDTWSDVPLDHAFVAYANHPGWWDPLIAFTLNRHFLHGRTLYAPMDAAKLRKYAVLRRLGVFGVDLKTLQGARQFLSTSQALLRCPKSALWLTPGGSFADVRVKTEFQPGLAHLAASVPNVWLVPVALEYTFWDERTPEALVEFGQPLRSVTGQPDKAAFQTELEARLADAQASLAQKSIVRDPDAFDVLLRGSAGVGGIYDLARRAKSLLTGRRLNTRHNEWS